jgi:hypothetical protein
MDFYVRHEPKSSAALPGETNKYHRLYDQMPGKKTANGVPCLRRLGAREAGNLPDRGMLDEPVRTGGAPERVAEAPALEW